MISRFVKGILIGAGGILPGISSGVLLVVFGLYDILVNTVLHFFKDVKKNFFFLLPIIFGCFAGIVLFGNVLNYFFSTFPSQTKFLFIGLIVGCFPSLIKQANKKGFKTHYILFFIITFIFAFSLVLLEKFRI